MSPEGRAKLADWPAPRPAHADRRAENRGSSSSMRPTGATSGRRAARARRALALAPCAVGLHADRRMPPTGPVVDVPPKYRAAARQAACRAAGAGLVARLSLGRADHAGRARVSRQSRHRGRGRAHRAGRCADAHRRRAAAAAGRFRRLGARAPAPAGAGVDDAIAPCSTRATRSTSGARTARRCAPRNSTRSRAASTAR